MNCLDSSAIIDYLEGEERLGDFLREHEHEPFFAPTVVLHEVFVGAARLNGAEGVRRVREDIDWIEPLPLSTDAAAEAAVLDAELRAAGEPVGPIDALVAGAIRAVGGTLITGDGDFERVPDLDVNRYR